MRKLTRAAAAILLGTSLAAVASAQPPGGPAPPAVPPLTPPGAGAVQGPATTAPAVPAARPKIEKRPEGNAAVVTTTLGAAPVVQQIPEVAVYRGLRQFPDSSKDLARKEIIGHLVENVLIDHYLIAIKVNVEQKDVDALIGELKKELVAVKKDYAAELAAMMLTEEEFRAEVQAQLKWEAFVKQQSTDVALQQLFASSPDVFDGSMVRARHILFTPGKNEAEQKEAAGKLRGIKQVIEQEAAKAVAEAPATADALAKEQIRAKKTEDLFSAFATRDSQCPSKKDGGDLNFFPRAGAMVEPFAKAAFETKIYQMSDVVITEFGYHLILVTARKAGTPKKYEEVKEDVKLLYAMKLREAVLAQMKPKSKIEILPAPTTAAGATTAVPAVPSVGGNVPK
ncbi:MAG TPA: peptidylprolyl isomerase [Urbifossiella sp.]|jgi:parvulin-like peptidyl-prolyl isomerase